MKFDFLFLNEASKEDKDEAKDLKDQFEEDYEELGIDDEQMMNEEEDDEEESEDNEDEDKDKDKKKSKRLKKLEDEADDEAGIDEENRKDEDETNEDDDEEPETGLDDDFNTDEEDSDDDEEPETGLEDDDDEDETNEDDDEPKSDEDEVPDEDKEGLKAESNKDDEGSDNQAQTTDEVDASLPAGLTGNQNQQTDQNPNPPENTPPQQTNQDPNPTPENQEGVPDMAQADDPEATNQAQTNPEQQAGEEGVPDMAQADDPEAGGEEDNMEGGEDDDGGVPDMEEADGDPGNSIDIKENDLSQYKGQEDVKRHKLFTKFESLRDLLDTTKETIDKAIESNTENTKVDILKTIQLQNNKNIDYVDTITTKVFKEMMYEQALYVYSAILASTRTLVDVLNKITKKEE